MTISITSAIVLAHCGLVRSPDALFSAHRGLTVEGLSSLKELQISSQCHENLMLHLRNFSSISTCDVRAVYVPIYITIYITAYIAVYITTYITIYIIIYIII